MYLAHIYAGVPLVYDLGRAVPSIQESWCDQVPLSSYSVLPGKVCVFELERWVKVWVSHELWGWYGSG